MTVGDYAAKWIERVQATRRPSTVLVYRSTMRLIVRALGSFELEALARRDVIAFADALASAGRSANYVRSAVRVLSTIYANAIDDELVAKVNPATGVARRYIRGARLGHPVARDHLPTILAMFGVIRPDLAPLVSVLAQTGLRLGEALALQWHRIDLVGHRAHIERTWLDRGDGPCKGREARVIHLFPETVALLAGLTRTGIYVFPGARGVPPYRCQVERAFARVTRRANLLAHAYTPHALRHSFATLSLEAGYSLTWVQQQCGHKSSDITRRLYGRYARVPTPAHLDSWNVLIRHRIQPVRPPRTRRAAGDATPLAV